MWSDAYDAQDILQEMYDIWPTRAYKAYSWTQVKSYIESGNLLYGAFYNAAYDYGHAVCINGYYMTQSDGILVMESLGGFYRQVYANSSGVFYMNISGLGNCTWQHSLVAKI